VSNTQLRLLIEEFNTEYADTLDRCDLMSWPNFFTDDAVYKITSQDNLDQGLLGGIVFDSGIGMIRDRAYILTNTQYFAPRRVRHLCGNVKILDVAENIVSAQSNFIYVETLVEEHSKLHLVGQYQDQFVYQNNQLRLKQRVVVYDNYVLNSVLVYPV
jgi:3-phenylpropionate/cinnamic acid dioxygenase small subunit